MRVDGVYCVGCKTWVKEDLGKAEAVAEVQIVVECRRCRVK